MQAGDDVGAILRIIGELHDHVLPGTSALGLASQRFRLASVQRSPEAFRASEYANPGCVAASRPITPRCRGPEPLALIE